MKTSPSARNSSSNSRLPPLTVEELTMRKPEPGSWPADRSHFRRPSRRDFLYVGLAGGLGLTLGEALCLQAQGGRPPRAQALIHIFLQGGFAHQDSFDPKPDAPVEYRGELGTIPTQIPGV